MVEKTTTLFLGYKVTRTCTRQEPLHSGHEAYGMDQCRKARAGGTSYLHSGREAFELDKCKQTETGADRTGSMHSGLDAPEMDEYKQGMVMVTTRG